MSEQRITETLIQRLRKQARDIKKVTGVRLHQALDSVANNHGYKTWAELMQAREGATNES